MFNLNRNPWYVPSLFSLLIILFSTPFLYSQITITQSELMQIFTPGDPFYAFEGEAGLVNVGEFGGPNDYDFTFVDLEDIFMSYNYEVSLIPVLADRYPLTASTIGDAPDMIVESPIFYSSGDSTYFCGEATVEEEYRFTYYEPYELFSGFPMSYLDDFWQVMDVYDTTYSLAWQVLSTYYYNEYLDVTVDAFGMLRLPGHDLECLRMKRAYSWYQYKEFLFVTREGVLLVVTDVSETEPDTGYINADYEVIMSSGFVGVDDEENTPSDYRLSQNYPNPFNAQTTIRYSLLEQSEVSIDIYDILGRKIETLLSDVQQAGYHQATWNAEDITSGVYFYKIQTGNYTETKKMMLLK